MGRHHWHTVNALGDIDTSYLVVMVVRHKVQCMHLPCHTNHIGSFWLGSTKEIHGLLQAYLQTVNAGTLGFPGKRGG